MVESIGSRKQNLIHLFADRNEPVIVAPARLPTKQPPEDEFEIEHSYATQRNEKNKDDSKIFIAVFMTGCC